MKTLPPDPHRAVQGLNPRFIQDTVVLARAKKQTLVAARTRSTGTTRFYAVKNSGEVAKRGRTLYLPYKHEWVKIRAHARSDDANLPKFWRKALR